jgi:hypothetical protein
MVGPRPIPYTLRIFRKGELGKTMTRSSRNVTLVLITGGLAALGFTVWDHGGWPSTSSATTRSTGGGGHSHFWWGRSGSGSGVHSTGSSFHGGTGWGGFGSSGHSVGA